MQNLIPLVLLVLFVYLIFFRKGGMGCCGGHGTHESERPQELGSGKPSNDHMENVIDLNEDQYSVTPSKEDKLP
jgi:hypothetical protein